MYILYPQSDMNKDTGEPLDTLKAEVLEWAKSISSTAKTVTEVISCQDPLVRLIILYGYINIIIKHRCYILSQILNIMKRLFSQIYNEINKAIKRVNTQAISNAQKVQKFTILPHDFSILTGELGPTLKLKRSEVTKMYTKLIDTMYQ